MKFLLRLIKSFPILTVNDKNESLCSSVVVPPERSNLVLSSDVPYIEFYILVRHGFYIETDYRSQRSAGTIINRTVALHTRWNSGDRLVQLQFVENRFTAPFYHQPTISTIKRDTHSSFQRHQDPTSTTASPYCQKFCLEYENAPTCMSMRQTYLEYGFSSPNAFERLAPMADDYPEVKERQRRDDVPKTKENMTNERRAIEY